MINKSNGIAISCYKGEYVTSPLYVSAFLGDYNYVHWKLQQGAITIGVDPDTACLVNCAKSGAFRRGHFETLRLYELFLDHGLSPHDILKTNDVTGKTESGVYLNWWQSLLVLAVTDAQWEGDTRFRLAFSRVIERFLERGADSVNNE
jgi:hypothetical protein